MRGMKNEGEQGEERGEGGTSSGGREGGKREARVKNAALTYHIEVGTDADVGAA
jgi:hypothetical protein